MGRLLTPLPPLMILLRPGSYNEAEAYLYFSRACLEFLRLSGRQPDVLHVHEWQASAVPMLVRLPPLHQGCAVLWALLLAVQCLHAPSAACFAASRPSR